MGTMKHNTELNYDKIFEEFGNPDSRGFIYIHDKSPSIVEERIKEITGFSSSQLRLKIISCEYGDGTVIKI